MKKSKMVFIMAVMATFISFGEGRMAMATDISVDALLICDNTTDPCYATIGGAIDAATSGDTISVYGGTYPEAITIDGKDLKLIAFGPTTHVILKPTGCTGHKDVVTIKNANVSIDGFIIDANYSESGCNGGIYVRGMMMGSYNDSSVTAVISNNTVFNYGKGGITANGSGANASILNNTITGRGPIGQGDLAQNGIQFGYGASGMARGNTISDNYYTGPDWSASGMLLFDVLAKNVKMSQNIFRNNQRNMLLLTEQACPHQFGGVYGNCSFY